MIMNTRPTFPSKQKLSEQELIQVCTYLRIYCGPRTYLHPVTMRGLIIKSGDPHYPYLQVHPLQHLSYATYFWWRTRDENGNINTREKIHSMEDPRLIEWWMSALTMFNETPTLIFDTHQQLQRHCLYYYRLPKPV